MHAARLPPGPVGRAAASTTATATSSASGSDSGSSPSYAQLHHYIALYLDAHKLPSSAWRYAYILWLVVAAAALAAGAHLALGPRLSFTPFAMWWRKRLARPSPRASFWRRPAIASAMLPVALALLLLALTLIGVDYTDPQASAWDPGAAFPSYADAAPARPPGTGPVRRMQWSQGSFPDVTTTAPAHALNYRTWWTVGDRLGLLTNALSPLVVLLALRQVPFALLSLRIFGANAFDRLAGLHAYAGHLLWVVATAHTVTWLIQAGKDTYADQRVLSFALVWTRFRWAIVSYIFLTLLVILSLPIIRRKAYELFYVSHVVCIAGFLVAGALHHPPLGPWLWSALAWWLAERALRGAKSIWTNALLFNPPYYARVPDGEPGHFDHDESYPMTPVTPKPPQHRPELKVAIPSPSSEAPRLIEGAAGQRTLLPVPRGGSSPANPQRSPTTLRKDKEYEEIDALISAYNVIPSPLGLNSTAASSTEAGLRLEDTGPTCAPVPASAPVPPQAAIDAAARILPIPPSIAAQLQPGWAYAQILPGQTIRLTIRVLHPMPWYPGQWLSLSLPEVCKWQSHPFTIASAVESAAFAPPARSARPDANPPASVEYQDGLTLVLLIRARRGFTRSLYNLVARACRPSMSAGTGRKSGATHLRAFVDGPYGSSPRVDWGAHHTAVVVCAGSGVAYGIAALQYLCAGMLRAVQTPCAAQAAASTVPGVRSAAALLGVPALPVGAARSHVWQTTQIHFVWIMRDLAHLLWAATPLRRCIEALPPNVLKVDLYVTGMGKDKLQFPLNMGYDYGYAEGGVGSMTPSSSMLNLNLVAPSSASIADVSVRSSLPVLPTSSTPTAATAAAAPSLPLDLTDFDGEDARPDQVDQGLNRALAAEGKLRRAHTRKATVKRRRRNKEKDRDKDRDKEKDNDSSSKFVHDASEDLPSSFSAAREGQRAVHEGWAHPVRPIGKRGSTMDLPLDAAEERDAQVLAELAHAGRPDLDSLVRSAARASTGPTLVTACGPPVLARAVRIAASKAADPAQVWRGDFRGVVQIQVESFDWGGSG